MNTNLAYQEEPREELLNGKIYMMSSPSVNHNRAAFHIAIAFQARLKEKTCEAFADGTDVYLTEDDRVIPDVMIICNKDIVKRDGIYQLADDSMIDREKETCIDTLPASLYNDFSIPLEEIFYNLFKEQSPDCTSQGF